VNILNLFPTPVGKFELGRDLTVEEQDFAANAERRPNMGNQSSADNYVLKNEVLSDLNKFLSESANRYFQEIYRPRSDVSLHITQSWLNYTNAGQFHHKHAHPNSFVSGVFYLNADITKDKIYFYKDGYQQIKLPPTDWNTWNSESWWFEAGIGILYMFPSSLTHMVEVVTAEKTRISLSFNTFLKGNIGDNHSLTELKIEE
jgi:uncharacterized protein (TIGR02466 family)